METDDLGNTTQIDWVYDDIGRLSEERYDTELGDGTEYDYIARYVHDLASNRVRMEKDLGNAVAAGFSADETTTYDYDDNDRLIRELIDDDLAGGVDRTILYEYGDNANLALDYAGDGTQQTRKAEYVGDDPSGTGTLVSETIHTYNNQGRLETVDTDSDGDGIINKRLDYKYNDAGIRVAQTETDDPGQPSQSITKTLYLIDGNNPTGYAQVLEEWDDANFNGQRDAGEQLLKSFVLGNDVISQWALANSLYYLLYDGHGSTRGLIDSAGQPLVGQVYAYDAYGNRLTGTGLAIGTPLTSLLYSGEFSDLATGLQYLRARYYDPLTGRFNRLDPFAGNNNDPISLHKYLYVHSDPVNSIDPSGLNAALAFRNGFGGVLSLPFQILDTLTRAAATIKKGRVIGSIGAGIIILYQLELNLLIYESTSTADVLPHQVLEDVVVSLNQVIVDAATKASVLARLRTRLPKNSISFHYSSKSLPVAVSLTTLGLVRFPGQLTGPFSTPDIYTSGITAKEALALPNPSPPDAAYIVSPRRGFYPVGPFPVLPKPDLAGNTMPGGGREYIFLTGSSGGTGTVFGPIPLPYP